MPISSLIKCKRSQFKMPFSFDRGGKFMTLRASIRFALEESIFMTGKFPSEWENVAIVFIYSLRRTLQPVICSNYRLGLININGLTTNWGLLHMKNSFSFTCTLALPLTPATIFMSALNFSCRMEIFFDAIHSRGVRTSQLSKECFRVRYRSWFALAINHDVQGCR